MVNTISLTEVCRCINILTITGIYSIVNTGVCICVNTISLCKQYLSDRSVRLCKYYLYARICSCVNTISMTVVCSCVNTIYLTGVCSCVNTIYLTGVCSCVPHRWLGEHSRRGAGTVFGCRPSDATTSQSPPGTYPVLAAILFLLLSCF